jgi:hypothetical protein
MSHFVMSHFDRFAGIGISKNRRDICCHPMASAGGSPRPAAALLSAVRRPAAMKTARKPVVRTKDQSIKELTALRRTLIISLYLAFRAEKPQGADERGRRRQDDGDADCRKPQGHQDDRGGDPAGDQG